MTEQYFSTIVGVVADKLGHCEWLTPTGRQLEAHPHDAYNEVQPEIIPIQFRHEAVELGRVLLLRRDANNLLAVAVVGPHPEGAFGGLDGALYFSALTAGDPEILVELTLTADPASVGLPPVRIFKGLPGEAKGARDRPHALLEAADDVFRAAHELQFVRCKFVDRIAGRREARERLDRRLAALDRPGPARRTDPGVDYYERPAGPIISVNGRPVDRQRD